MQEKFNPNIDPKNADFMSAIVQSIGCKIYLELGVLEGYNMREISKHCNTCIGVDINDILIFKDFDFHLKSSDDFFKDFNKTPDVIFIDADHHFEQVKKDFVNSLNCLNENGMIFLHDTDPVSKELLDQKYCGDAFKIHDWIKENYSDLNIVTLPISDSGLSIVNRDKDRRIINS